MRVKPLLLLAYVALEGSKARRHLAELFWPDAADPLNSLSAALKQLRQYAPGAVEGDHSHISSAVECDARTFLQGAEAGHNEQALKLYRGPFLSGVYLSGWSAELEEWVYGTREFLASRARNAWLRSGEDIAANGRFEEAAKCAVTAYLLPEAPELEPEELTRVHALLAAGNSPQLSRFRNDSQGFGIEFSLSPASAREQLRRLPDPAKALPGQGLPKRGTAFIGRDVELVEAANYLARADCSLLTLTGPGGVGKSRLAVRVAHDLSERYPGGVYFVPLEALNAADLIPPSIARALGLNLQGSEDPLVQVARSISDQTMLLVLDNYEHLLDGATIAAHLIQNCPNLKLLVTSREHLNLEEEWVLPLEGLAIPRKDILLAEVPHHDAVELFVERAKRARLSLEPTPEELPHVVRICQQVQGLPLGIELAAAWVRMLSCEEIAQEIGRTTDFLSSNSKSVPARHKSIRAVFEGSWRLLKLKEQEVLRKLSAFQGGFRREAAAEVVGVTIPVLASLADKSLLSVNGSGRYSTHPLLHQYVREKLSEHPQEQEKVKDEHASYYLALAEQAETQIRGPAQILWLDRLEEELDNLRAALDWTEVSDQEEPSLQLAAAMWPFWGRRGYPSEGRERLRRVLLQPRATKHTPVRAKALNGAGGLASMQGDFASARSLFRESLAVSREVEDKQGIAYSLYRLGRLALDQTVYTSASSLFKESLAIHRELGDERGLADCLYGLGIVALDQADYASASSLFKESLAIHRELGDRWGIAHSLHSLGIVALHQADYASARPLIEESLARSRELGDKQSVARSLRGLSRLALDQADYASARPFIEKSLAIHRELGDRWGIAETLRAFAALSAVEGRPKQAARLWGAAEVLRETIGATLAPSERPRNDHIVEAALGQLGKAAFSTTWAEGRIMPLGQAISCALESE